MVPAPPRLALPVPADAPGSSTNYSAAPDADQLFWTQHEELRMLGHGHFGTVSLVRRLATGGIAAAKVVKKASALARCPSASPVDEATILAQLRHPNIVRLLDVVETPATLFLLLEPLVGGDLLSRMRASPDGILAVDETKLYVRSILGALAFMHHRGFVHRDVKPSNVLLASDGTARLADFGLAASLPRPGERCLTSVCGTQEFLAPEMVLCGHGELMGYGHEVDLWGIGLLVFACLYGFNPFQRPTEIETLSAILAADYTIPEVALPRAAAASPALGLIARLLVVDPSKRMDASACLREDPWIAGIVSTPDSATDNGEIGEDFAVGRQPKQNPFAAMQRHFASVFGQ